MILRGSLFPHMISLTLSLSLSSSENPKNLCSNSLRFHTLPNPNFCTPTDHNSLRQIPPSNQMTAKPLTSAAIAMTEKKMDMTLDDIIKMSKTGTGNTKAKKQRVPNKNQKFSNTTVQDKSMRLRRFMDSRSSLRQGVLAQRRSSFQGNQFPLAAEAARKAAVAPIRNRNFNQSRARTVYKPRVIAPPVENRATQGGFDRKQQQQQQQVKVVSKQRPKTLDSLFANMKEQRMKFQSQQNSVGRRNGVGQQRPRPPWGRYNN